MLKSSLKRFLGFAAVLLAGLDANASTCPYGVGDSKTYLSADGSIRFTVDPAQFIRVPDDVHPAGSFSQQATPCKGRLERKRTDDTYREMWAATLGNRMSPSSALVSDGGKFVATFNNACSRGYGRNVVSIYSSEGKLIRDFSLLDLLTEKEIGELHSSFDYISWGHGHYFDSAWGRGEYLKLSSSYLVLRIIEGGGASGNRDLTFQEIQIELPDARLDRPESLLDAIERQGERCEELGRNADFWGACTEGGDGDRWCGVCLRTLQDTW
jgi:hypothetical protein